MSFFIIDFECFGKAKQNGRCHFHINYFSSFLLVLPFSIQSGVFSIPINSWEILHSSVPRF